MNKLYILQVIGSTYITKLYAPNAEIAITEAKEYRGLDCVVVSVTD